MKRSTVGNPAISRRGFLKLCASAGGVAVLGALPDAAFASGDAAALPAVLIDVTRCVGCNNCQRACNVENGLTPSTAQLGTLSAQTFTFVDRKTKSSGEDRFVKRACMHCLEPACVSACTVGALKRNGDGIVKVDEARCIGCRYCQYACPFGVPQFEWEGALGVVRKCDSCMERLAEGKIPACAEACPSGALKYGQRGELLQVARSRIDAGTAQYVNYVYGEHEVGGTARLYLSDVPFEELGLPVLSEQPAPHYAEEVMTRTPVIAVSVAAVCTGLYSIISRREKNGVRVKIDEQERLR